MRLGEVEASIEKRKMGGDDDIVSPERAAARTDRRRVSRLHACCASLLEDVATVAVDQLGEGSEVLRRMKLRLIPEPDGAGDGKRKRELADEVGIEACLLGRLRFLA